jgi:hypothetical protein
MSLFIDRMNAARTASIEKRGPRDHDTYTVGDTYDAIFSIDNEQDARAFYEGYVQHISEQPDLKDDPVYVVQSNIGWMFGEGMSDEMRAMWIRVCDASHPVFGQTMPTIEQAFGMGQDLG